MLKLQKYNKHWNDGFRYEYEKHRDLFNDLINLLGKKQIIAITGLRRTGKTVLMKQVINHLIHEGIKERNILYFSFDEEKPKIDDLMQEYAETTDIDLDKEKTYIFLDEIQKLENWQEQLKVYYDNYPSLKLFISGSSSLFIRKKATESLAGRIYILELTILNFREFLRFRNKETLLEHIKMHSDILKREVLVYLKRSFVEILDEEDKTAAFYMESIVNKIVYEDIPAIFPVEHPDKLKAIIKIIYSSPGIMINYENLGNDLGLSSKTIEKYLFYLLQAKLIKKLYNFSRNFLTSEKKLKKFYVTAPCFCFLNDEYDLSKIAENAVALDANFFWRDSSKNEVDAVFKKEKEILPVEIKFKNDLKEDDLKSINLFINKFKLHNGIIVSKDLEKEETFDSKKIKYVPLWKWLIDKGGTIYQSLK